MTRPNSRAGFDEYAGRSTFCSERIACELLAVNPWHLGLLVKNGDLTAPLQKSNRWLYVRAQIRELRRAMQPVTHATGWRTGRPFPKVKLHLRRVDCAIPSTWWEQARAIADTLPKPRRYRRG